MEIIYAIIGIVVILGLIALLSWIPFRNDERKDSNSI